MPIKVEELLAPVSVDDPAGPSLQWDPDYAEMKTLVEGVPQKEMGESVIPGVDPDWPAAVKATTAMLKRTKDLQTAVYLDLSLLRTEGLPGLRDGLRVLKGMVELYWDVFFPKLDPDDNNDPTERVNILRAFASRDAGIRGDSTMVMALREAPLTDSRAAGRFGLRDIAIANGEITVEPKEGETNPDPGLIEAAARDTDGATLQGMRDAATEAATLVKEIETLVDQKVGAGAGVDFKDFNTTLQAAGKQLDRFLSYHGMGEAPPDDVPSQDGGAAPAKGTTSAPSRQAGEVASNADVIRMLEKICAFYERTEPSSPIPLLLRRAQRLVGKNFWEVLQELSPDAIHAIKVISGQDPKAPE